MSTDDGGFGPWISGRQTEAPRPPSSTDHEANVRRLLAIEEAREERRVRRNKILVWVVVAAVILGIVAGVVLKKRADEAAHDKRVCEMYSSMTGGDRDDC